MFAFAMLGVLHVFELHGLELFQLFFGENLVEVLYALDSVVEQTFLSLEDICLGCCDFLVVIAVEGFAESLFCFLLLFAKFLECRIHHAALLFQSGLLFRSYLQYGVHEGFAFLKVEFLIELLVEMLAFEVRIARWFAAEVVAFVVRAFAKFFTMAHAMWAFAVRAARGFLFATVCFFLAAVHVLLAAITRLEFANSVFGTCREAGVVECECSNEEAERASENNQACDEGFC